VDLLDILRVVRRRWKVALLAAIAGFGLLILASSAVEPDWDGTAIVVLDPPASRVTLDPLNQPIIEEFNPLTGGDAASGAVPRLAVVATSQETRTTFARAGLSTQYDIEYVQRQPYMTLTVTDADPDRVVATIDAVVDFLKLEVTAIQDNANINDNARAKITVLAETEIAANQTAERRAQGVILVLTLAGAVAAATLTDLFFRRRDEATYADRYSPDPQTETEPVDESEQVGEVTPLEKPNRWQRRSGSA
jgi:hypothetical protein